jgi:hypothetical protein
MASIWICEGKTEHKVYRHDNPAVVRNRFTELLAHHESLGAKVEAISGYEATVVGGMIGRNNRALFFIELMAPPSKPEKGQPIGTAGGVLASNGKVYAIDLHSYAKAG